MDVFLYILIVLLVTVILLLLIKIHLLRKSAEEIRKAFSDRLSTETNTLIDISSQDHYLCALATDINEQLKKLRQERHRYKQGDLAVKETIAGISHDLRTPLTAICGYLDLLEEEETSETAKQYLDIIRDRANALKKLTEELLSYSIAASSAASLVFKDTVLNHVLEESISSQYAMLRGCGITPVISMPEEKIIRRLDKNALFRIFENIISNAIKYRDGDLQITLSVDGQVTFSNHAAGLCEVDVQKLFDRLYTVETGVKSTGLGLSIAKTLTEQMNGQISARYVKGVLFIDLRFPHELFSL